MKTLLLAALISTTLNAGGARAVEYEATTLSTKDAIIEIASYKACVAWYSINYKDDNAAHIKSIKYAEVVNTILESIWKSSPEQIYNYIDQMSEEALNIMIKMPEFKTYGAVCDAVYEKTMKEEEENKA